MSKEQTSDVAAVVFGDLDADLWGVLIDGIGPIVSVSSLSSAEPAFVRAAIERSDAGTWTVSAPGVALRVTPSDAVISTTEATGLLRPVSVAGAATVDGVERELELGGVELGRVRGQPAGSLRLFAGWFPGGRALGLLAAREAGAKGHDHDQIEVAAAGEEHPLVLDPRMSTTYDRDELPLRVGIELWLTDSPDAEEQWSRRVAGMATGSRVTATNPLRGLSAHALRCASGGEEGAGVYLLAGSN